MKEAAKKRIDRLTVAFVVDYLLAGLPGGFLRDRGQREDFDFEFSKIRYRRGPKLPVRP